MSWEAIGAVGEIIGAVAVVATLFYLARQTHRNVELERAKQQRVIIDQFNEYVKNMTEPGNLMAVRKGFVSLSSLEADDQATAWRNYVQWVNYYEQMIYSYEGGLVPKAILDAVGGWVLAMLITPGGSEYWTNHGDSHGIDVQEKLGEMLRDAENLPPPITEMYPWLDFKV